MLLRNTRTNLLGAAVAAPAALGVSVLLAQWLDPADNGRVQAALSLLTVLGLGAQLGTVAAGIHRVRRARRPPGLVVATGLLSVTLTGALAVGALALLPLGERFLVAAPGLMLACVLPLLWTNVLAGAARAVDDFATSALADAMHQVGRLVALGLAALVAPAGAVAAMGAVLVAQIGVAAVTAGRVLPRTGLAPPTDLEELGATTAFGARTYLHTLTGQLHERVDLLLLAALDGDPVELATYAVAVGVVNRVRVVPLALSSALYPAVAGATHDEGRRLTARACRHAAAWTVVAGAALAAAAGPLIPRIWGEVYAASVGPLWVLLPGTAAFSVALVLGRYFQAVDRQGVNIAAQTAGVALNLALNLWLIPRHGALGAAAASLVSYSLQAAWVGWAFVR